MIRGRDYIDGRWQAAAFGRERTVIKPYSTISIVIMRDPCDPTGLASERL